MTSRAEPSPAGAAVAARYLHAAGGILRRDAAVFASYRLRVMAQLIGVLFSLVIFYYVSRLVTVGQFRTPDEYFAYVSVGLVIFGILTATLGSTAAAIRQELVAGTFERVAVSPFGAVGALVSMMLFPFIYAVATGAATLTIAAAVFGLPIESSTAPLALPAALLAMLAFLPFSLLLAAAVIAVKQAATAGNLMITGISLVAGLYFPVSLLPSWIQWASEVQPFTPATELLRNLLVGTPMADSTLTATGRLAAFAVLLIPPSLWLLTLAVRAGRRRGTLIEY
jgi:ABC-2 type transport system permease protein